MSHALYPDPVCIQQVWKIWVGLRHRGVKTSNTPPWPKFSAVLSMTISYLVDSSIKTFISFQKKKKKEKKKNRKTWGVEIYHSSFTIDFHKLLWPNPWKKKYWLNCSKLGSSLRISLLAEIQVHLNYYCNYCYVKSFSEELGTKAMTRIVVKMYPFFFIKSKHFFSTTQVTALI